MQRFESNKFLFELAKYTFAASNLLLLLELVLGFIESQDMLRFVNRCYFMSKQVLAHSYAAAATRMTANKKKNPDFNGWVIGIIFEEVMCLVVGSISL